MSDAPQTAYYFDPLRQRLALVARGLPLPDPQGHWALVIGADAAPEDVIAEVARRWPDADVGELDILLVTDPADVAARDAERAAAENVRTITVVPRPMSELAETPTLRERDLVEVVNPAVLVFERGADEVYVAPAEPAVEDDDEGA